MDVHDSDHRLLRSGRIDDSRGAAGHLRLFARYSFRVVRFLHLRHARSDPRRAVLCRRQSVGGLHLYAARLRRRICGATVRSPVLRPARRSDRPQIHLPHHHDADGAGHILHRPAAQLRRVGNRCADHADLPAPVPGAGARRRVRRGGHLRRRTFPEEQARVLHVVDPDDGHRGPVHGAAHRARHPHLDGRDRIRRPRIADRRLAHSIPALGDPARGVDLDQVEAQRIAGLPADEGRGPRLEAPADRGVRPMGQPQDRDPRPAGRNRRRSRGLVRRPVLRAVLPDPDAQSPGGDGADPDRGRDC